MVVRNRNIEYLFMAGWIIQGIILLVIILLGIWQQFALVLVGSVIANGISVMGIWTGLMDESPLSKSKERRGNYVILKQYDQETGRFLGAAEYSVDEMMGIANIEKMKVEKGLADMKIEAMNKEIRELKKKIERRVDGVG
jgi:hypothetical protein